MRQSLHAQSFSKKERLTGAKNFVRVYRKGKRIKLPGLTIISARNYLPYCRIGISASKKIGGATERNRAKRLIRELFRTNKWIFPSGYDLIFVPYRKFFHLDWNELKSNLVKAFDASNRC
ncbi:MAG: ribonuclease P protein component [Deltaproteobacteria bacterium]|nr:ribonuclease P protein component [Deltaproteobacteria bacterium]